MDCELPGMSDNYATLQRLQAEPKVSLAIFAHDNAAGTMRKRNTSVTK
jgi:hypothetical protein